MCIAWGNDVATAAAFLRTIGAAGDNLTPRLVFADWLDEQGQTERATFIRAQVLVATTPTDSPERRRAAQTAARLERALGQQWAGPLAEQVFEWQYRAGFPDLVGVTATQLQQHGPDLFAQWPIRSLTVTQLAGQLDVLQVIPPDNGITRLALLGARLTPAHLGPLVALDRWPCLRTLSLAYNFLDDSIVDWLITHPFFTRLERIELGANALTPATESALQTAFPGRIRFDLDREPDYLYTIENDDPFYCGTTADGQQLVLLEQNEDWLARFDLAGNLLAVGPVPEIDPEDDRSTLEQLGAEYGRVRVKRFTLGEDRVLGMPSLREYFADLSADPQDNDFAHGVLESWLHAGEWAFGVYILNRAGEVVAT
jgi:uncharacterized protein (TIGR02996 family)